MVRALAGMPEEQVRILSYFFSVLFAAKTGSIMRKGEKFMDKKQSAIIGITGVVLSAVGGICTIVYELFSKKK